MITLLYVRPASHQVTELDHRVGAIAQRYRHSVELKVIAPEELDSAPGDVGRIARTGSPALFLLRGDEVVGEAMGARLPARELDDVVRRAVEWPAPP